MSRTKGIFLWTIGRLAYRRFKDSEHWHEGITMWSTEVHYDKMLDLTIMQLGCLYWRTTPLENERSESPTPSRRGPETDPGPDRW